MIEILQYGFMQRAFIAGIAIALFSAAIGLFLVLRRMALLGDGLAHISFGGIAAGMLFGFYPIISAIVFSVMAAFGIQKLKQMKIYSDSAIAIFFSFGLALGVVMISLSHGFNADLFSYLFGSILAVNTMDIFLILAFGIGILFTICIFYKELLFITFDEYSARASGIPVEKLDTVLMVLAAVAVVLSMRIVGILLVSSLMVIPPSTALLVCRGFKQAIIISMIIAASAVMAGLVLAYYFDLAAGGAIVMVLAAAFSMALVCKNALTV